MARPAVTKGDIERAMKAALASGLAWGQFEVRVEGGAVRVLPCVPVRVQAPAEPNLWDEIAPAA